MPAITSAATGESAYQASMTYILGYWAYGLIFGLKWEKHIKGLLGTNFYTWLFFFSQPVSFIYKFHYSLMFASSKVLN